MLDGTGCLVVSHIELQLLSFALKFIKDLFKSLNDVFIAQTFDWYYKNLVSIVIIGHEAMLISIQGFY